MTSIHTASMSYINRYYEETRERHSIIFITAKHKSPFAPTWDMVKQHKAGTMSDEEYTDLYMKKMRALWKKDRSLFDEILDEPSVVLVCFCPTGKFCHRHLLANI